LIGKRRFVVQIITSCAGDEAFAEAWHATCSGRLDYQPVLVPTALLVSAGAFSYTFSYILHLVAPSSVITTKAPTTVET
jgi:hypothetical protein